MKGTEKNYLISTGGCGMEFVKYNFDFDFGTHHRNMFIPENVNFVYLFSHPYNILLSYNRRGFITHGRAINQVQGNCGNAKLNFVTNLDEYLNINIDCFMFGNHFNNYYSQDAVGLFIKHEALFNNLDSAMNKMGIKRVHNQKVVNRKSNYNNINKNLLARLKERHGRYAKHFEKLPLVFTNEVKNDKYFYNEKWD